jgi:release factor glutamine methyltransferase
MATIGELLLTGTSRLRTSGSESARLDAELLLAWAVGIERVGVIAHPEAPVGLDAASAFEAALCRREKGEPVAYIRGIKEFHGLAFSVDARALIPRPETELMVDEAERDVAWRLTSAPRPAGTPKIRVVDVGTGSGAVAVALATRLGLRRMLSEVAIVAADCSAEALSLAKENAVAHAVADAIEFVVADLVPGISGGAAPSGPVGGAVSGPATPFDVVLANLPYIPSADVDRLPVAASFEPRLALDGGPDGLAIVGRLIGLLPSILSADGSAYLEIGWDQRFAVEALAARLPGEWSCEIKQDLSGRDRLVEISRGLRHRNGGR